MLNQMYEDYCANRLPCGICRLTNSQCPKVIYNLCGDTVPTTSPTIITSTTYVTQEESK